MGLDQVHQKKLVKRTHRVFFIEYYFIIDQVYQKLPLIKYILKNIYCNQLSSILRLERSNFLAVSTSGAKYLSTVSGVIFSFTLSIIFSNTGELVKERKSLAFKTRRSSIDDIYVAFSISCLAFLEANPPIDTWSYCPADVTIESIDAGLTNTLLYDKSAAVVSIQLISYIVRS